MSADPRAALAAFVSALERHLEAASSRRGENDPAVVAAYQDVAEAFDRYEDALMDAYEEVTPLEIYSDEDDDDLEDDDDFDDEDDEEDFDDEESEPYVGLDEDEFDDADDDEDDGDDDGDDEDDKVGDDSDRERQRGAGAGSRRS